MSWVGLAVGVGGAVAGTAGNMLTAGQQNRAVRRAGDDNARDLRGQQGALGAGVFGPGYGQLPTYQFLYGQGLERQDQNMINQALAGLNGFVNSQGGPVMDQLRQLANSVSERQTGNIGRFDSDTSRLGQFSAQTGANLGNFMNTSRDDLLRGYDQGAANIYNNAVGAENMARDWGRGNADIIRRESGRDLEAANRQATRGLNSRGLGNTTVLNQAQASNQARTAEQRNNALQANNNAQIDRQLGARGQTLGIQQNLHNTRAGFQAQQNNAIADAMRQLGESQIGREYQRSGERMGLENANLTRDIGLRQDPINLLYQTLSGGIMNPYGSQQFPVPAASASGAALNTAGNLLTAGGNYVNNQNNFDALLEALRRNRNG